jgi:hypothetical protein
MRKYIIVGSFWLGTVSAAFALLERGLDVIGLNNLQFATRGSGEIGYHSFMDGTIFFYIISIAMMTYDRFNSQSRLSAPGEENKTKAD